jgi:gamma-glutamyltranspeptidase/glutathione hydrolase
MFKKVATFVPVLLLCVACLPQAEPDKAVVTDNEDIAPEAATGFTQHKTASAREFMAVSAHPLATKAAYDMLEKGGSAVDASIAAQLVLGLVEPQSSGIGGGAFMMSFNAETQKLVQYDGRETAPSAVDENHFMSDGKPISFFKAVVGGYSVGVPGLVKMLEHAHKAEGKLPWASLFEPAIRIATEGFLVSPRLHTLLKVIPKVAEREAITAYFFDQNKQPHAIGYRLKNPDYARTLTMIAEQGSQAFYEGEIAEAIVSAVQNDAKVPGLLSLADMKSYEVKLREPVCGQFKSYTACGPAMPSSGGLTVLNILGVLEAKNLAQWAPDSVAFTHLFAEANKLAFADRNRYMGDSDFVDVPVAGLLNPDYWQARSTLVKKDETQAKFPAGEPAANKWLSTESPERPSTSHLNVIDAEGNAVSMTTTIESGFGSRLFVKGFLLNNQLTDFSFVPVDAQKERIANRIQAGKRPRSSMSPFVIFDEDKNLKLLIGSPGGSQIIAYVARVIANVLGQGVALEEAVNMPHIVARNNAYLDLEKGRFSEAQRKQLQEKGHTIRERGLNSGLHGIYIENGVMTGVADARREGVALGR